ncbi:arginase family protein [Novosphingobium sp. 1949]|uniref:Arginase family protein n=1 Tax=Novosphingobium organovorum TaxID=2930092 RepID=A0ABT0BBS2_9SPHN|nr:arginase family protein [Novosphingobium organovorum]MCJ2182512.1 arginase family protein [Novosphingobium organovorum]
MTIDPKSVLRLNMGQWQGGDQPMYRVGAHVLAALAPAPTGPVETIAVPPATHEERTVEQGIKSRPAVLRQFREAQAAIARHAPEAIVTLGGDCLVDLAPMAYLNERYEGDLAILWVDAHPDIMGPEQYSHSHAHVLGNLMGYGDPDFGGAVPRPVKPEQILYVGVNDMLEYEQDFVARHAISVLSPSAIAENPGAVREWFAKRGYSRVAIHYDLDVLDPALYPFLYFTNPHVDPSEFDGLAKGKMTMEQVAKILKDVATVCEVVGIAIAEFLPWSLEPIKNGLETLPLLGKAG